MLSLKNELLKIQIKDIGAELCAITSVKNNTEFMWNADTTIWGSHAPNLFPIIGALKNNAYIYRGTMYHMPKHGFVRHNKDILLQHQTNTTLTFSLSSNPELFKIYPFQFKYEIAFTLSENVVIINHKITNTDTKSIYFSLGGHPAFKCPVYDNEKYSDYFLEFEFEETSKSHLLNKVTGLITEYNKEVIIEGRTIKLNDGLFNEDALIFSDLNSKKISLKHISKGPILSVHYKDFPYLGLWAKPNASFICIEPWQGIADHETSNQNIETKEGIVKLSSGTDYEASYSIEIDKRHLG